MIYSPTEYRGSLSIFALLLAGACTWGPEAWLSNNQAAIDKATRAVETASNDAELARSLTARGHAYSERARYSTTLNVKSPEERRRWFDLAIEDHNRAVALTPHDARAYLERGLTWYFGAAVRDASDPQSGALYEAAVADFTSVLEQDARNEQALDMRGVSHLARRDFDAAIDDFTRVLALDKKLGRLRLGEAYCNRAAAHRMNDETELAISDYEASVAVGIPDHSCECQPDSALAGLYLETKRYDKSWEVVRRARAARRWIAPELVEQLRTASGGSG
jgi:tetratricopeptide (TPR) repeat protein